MGMMRKNPAVIFLALATLVVGMANALTDGGPSPVAPDLAGPVDPFTVAETNPAEAEGEPAAVTTTCEEPGSFSSTSVGVSRFRGNVFRIDDHPTDEPVKLREIAMELRFTGNVQLHFSVFAAPSDVEEPAFARAVPDIVVARNNNGSQLFFGTGTISPAITLLPGNDYLIGVSWTQTDNPVTTNRGVTVGNDGSGAPLPPFLHGETLGLVVANGVTPPLASPFTNPTIFNTFGAYSMRLCFDPVPGACCAPTAPCTRTAEAACDEIGSFFHGERSSCVDIFCDYGACCGPCGDTACTPHYTAEACAVEGGEWTGSGVPCTPGLCETIIGACCTGAECAEMCIDDCLAVGGTYRGDFTTCEPNFCGGACCAATVGCADVTSAICGFLQGTFRGNGTTCAGLTPEQECGGACCATIQGQPVCLQVNNRSQCSVAQGLQDPVYVGDRVACTSGICTDVVGAACCLPNGSCARTTQEYCQTDAGGNWFQGQTCSQVNCTGCCVDGACVMLPVAGVCPTGDLDSCVPNTCDDVTGACCLLDPLLGLICEEDQTAASCRELDGRFQPGESCTACSPDLGACCRPNGACDDLVLPDECQFTLLGVHQGPGTRCDDVAHLCENRGACCTDGGSCAFVTEAGCTSLTESTDYFLGVGVACLPGVCPSGACCDLTTETCGLRRADACAGENLVYQGNGTTCEPGMCSLGACCVDTDCLHVLEGQCVNGTFSPNVDCASPDACVLGACCRNGECSSETRSACESADGVYQGANAACNAALCALGSCCRRDNTCEDGQVLSQCEEPDGLQFRPGISCASPVACERFGACCLPDGTCEELTTTECEDRHGILSPGATCGEVTCTAFGACCLGGVCSEVQGIACTGIYLGDGSICEAGTCAVGSCCTSDEPPQCEDGLIEFECSGMDGLHRPGVTCAAGPSCDLRGACCFEETGSCADDVRPGVCGAGGGVFTPEALCSEVACDLKGACCADGACSVATQAACEAGGGVYVGDQEPCTLEVCRLGACCHLDGTCDDNALRGHCTAAFDQYYEGLACAATCIGRGACCLPDHICQDAMTELQCGQVAGVYDGDGSVCTDDLCVIGACCTPGDPPICDDVTFTRLACELTNGAYQGADVLCAEGLCAIGSCCRVDGVCEDDLFGSECPAPDIFREGILCNDAQTPCVARGACCLGETCALTTLADCLGQGGVFGGSGTLCDPADQCASGACCLTDGGCAPRRKRECEASSGFFQGAGSTCADAGLDCTRGACCEVDGTCNDDLLASACTAENAVFTGGGDCDTLPCDPQGACCDGGVCSFDTQANCVIGGGSFLGAATTCDPNPCQSIMIVSSNPPNCAIDARQPSAPDGSAPSGWNTLELTFDGDAAGLNAGSFLVTVVGPGAAPGISGVTPAGATATIALDGFIPLQSWTCVEHVDSASKVCIAHLPADVSNDRTSSAPDILYLIDCLNAVRTCDVRQCDVDRSNVCGPPDILRVIDLLNGAGAFDPWLNVNMPVCPSAP